MSVVILWSLGRLSSRAQPATAPVGLGVWRIFDELLPPRHLWSGSSAPRTMICLKYHLGKLQNSQRSFGIFNYEVKPTLLSKLITYQSLLFRVEALIRPTSEADSSRPKRSRRQPGGSFLKNSSRAIFWWWNLVNPRYGCSAVCGQSTLIGQLLDSNAGLIKVWLSTGWVHGLLYWPYMYDKRLEVYSNSIGVCCSWLIFVYLVVNVVSIMIDAQKS